ncbi:MAG: ribosome small subunit-dependent GTPase A [Firmicutes bacterium]|nr:ribosome small subunit-dependent GTPase A [Bacillota bacterium]
MYDRLKELGFTEERLQEAAVNGDLMPGRVIARDKNLYRVAVADRDLPAEVGGRFRYQVVTDSDYPAVGDFVLLDNVNDHDGPAIIQQVMSRSGLFERKAAGTDHETQVLAANVDLAFICMALNSDYNLRRLERYLSLVWAGGAIPVVVLTKADLCPDLSGRLAEVKAAAPGVDVLLTSGLTEDGYKPITDFLESGKTFVFLGSSGVGKSTLINRLLGSEQIKTREIRKDGKGKHTTTRRELILIPGGGAVIDTPGMRELGLESANLAQAFSDIEKLAITCKFNDCSHTSEPGCAVLRAVEEGTLDPKRLANYRKLLREAKYVGLNSKQLEREKINEMFSGFGSLKQARDYIKHKSKKH